MSALPRRIVKETQRLTQEPGAAAASLRARARPAAHPRARAVPGISATPYEDNLRYFNVLISGPTESPYDGAVPAPPPPRAPRADPHVRRRHLQARAFLAGGLPHGAPEGAVPDEDLPSERRQIGTHLPRHPQGQVVPGAPDPHGPPLHPGAPLRAEPGRPPRQQRRGALEEKRTGGAQERSAPASHSVDAFLSLDFVRPSQPPCGQRRTRRAGDGRSGPPPRAGSPARGCSRRSPLSR